MVNKRLLKKAVVNAGGVTKFAQAIDVSIATVSRALARDDIAFRLCTVSKLERGIRLFAAPTRRPGATQDGLSRGGSLTDHFLPLAADLERWAKPDEGDWSTAICEQLLQWGVQAEELELRCSGA